MNNDRTYVKPRFSTQIVVKDDYTICKVEVSNFDTLNTIYKNFNSICRSLNIPTYINEPRKNFKGVVKRYKDDENDTYFAKKMARKKALDKVYKHYYKFFNDINNTTKRISYSITDSYNFCTPREDDKNNG